jgi:CRP-like cAMP-binding protein
MRLRLRFVIFAVATSRRKRSVVRLVAASLPRARRMAAMSASSFATAFGETHCFVAVVVCFVAVPQAVTQRAAQQARTSARSTTPS